MAAWNEAQANEILQRHEGREGALLPILHDVQAAFGHVPAEGVKNSSQFSVFRSRLIAHGFGFSGVGENSASGSTPLTWL